MNQLEKIKLMQSLREYPKELIKSNRRISKSQQKFKSSKYNVFTEEFKKAVLNANNDKRIQ